LTEEDRRSSFGKPVDEWPKGWMKLDKSSFIYPFGMKVEEEQSSSPTFITKRKGGASSSLSLRDGKVRPQVFLSHRGMRFERDQGSLSNLIPAENLNPWV
jgi:hypothetical protein